MFEVPSHYSGLFLYVRLRRHGRKRERFGTNVVCSSTTRTFVYGLSEKNELHLRWVDDPGLEGSLNFL